MEVGDGVITRESIRMPDLSEINKSLLETILMPPYWNAIEDYNNAFYEENQYYEDLIQKRKKHKQMIIDSIDGLNPEDPIYQLNKKAFNSMSEYPELSEGRIEDVFDFSEDYYEDYDEDYDEERERYEDYSKILLDIQRNYEKAISRHSSYSANLKRHIASWNWLVYSPFINDESILVWQLQWDIFLVSHFAPSSMKMGYYLIRQALHSKMPIVFAVPDYLAKQLRKAWFEDLWFKVPQIFDWEVVMKNVLINDAVTEGDIKGLIEEFSGNYLWFSR